MIHDLFVVMLDCMLVETNIHVVTFENKFELECTFYISE